MENVLCDENCNYWTMIGKDSIENYHDSSKIKYH